MKPTSKLWQSQVQDEIIRRTKEPTDRDKLEAEIKKELKRIKR